MVAALLLAAALLPAPAQSDDWRDIVAGPQSTWAVRGNVSTQAIRSVVSVIAIVRRTANDGTEQQFLAAVPLAHCGATRGDLVLQPLEAGQAQIAGVWERGSNASATQLAVALCTEFRRART